MMLNVKIIAQMASKKRPTWRVFFFFFFFPKQETRQWSHWTHFPSESKLNPVKYTEQLLARVTKLAQNNRYHDEGLSMGVAWTDYNSRFKIAFTLSGKPILQASPQAAGILQALPPSLVTFPTNVVASKQFQCCFHWRWPFLVILHNK